MGDGKQRSKIATGRIASERSVKADESGQCRIDKRERHSCVNAKNEKRESRRHESRSLAPLARARLWREREWTPDHGDRVECSNSLRKVQFCSRIADSAYIFETPAASQQVRLNSHAL
jgi:hypothetical protein